MKSQAKAVALLLALVSLAIGILVSCDATGPLAPGGVQNYPTTYPRLSVDSLNTLSDSLARVNSRTCPGLDDYGFTRADWCGGQATYQVGDSISLDSLTQIAKADILRLTQFTGVRDAEYLDFRFMQKPRIHGGLILFGVGQTHNQLYTGIEVLNTTIVVWVDTLGIILIDGHHYPYVHFPEPNISLIESRELVVGLEIEWAGFDGSPNIYTVTDESFCLMDDPRIVVVPLESVNGMEMRVAWQIGVGCDDPESGFAAWDVYVDVVTEELVLTVQNFVT